MGREGCSLGSASTVLPHTLEAASQSRLAANPACTNSKGVLPGPIRHKRAVLYEKPVHPFGYTMPSAN